MAGVRIQHPTQRNVRVTVVESDKPYPVPYQCTPPDLGGCGSVHQWKTHHINLDAVGAAIVSETVYARIKRGLTLAGFATTGQIKRPPAIGIGLSASANGTWGNIPILHV